MNKTARVILDRKCSRKCYYCCNNYKSIMNKAVELSDVHQLSSFNTVCVTGGEPMQFFRKTLEFINDVRKINQSAVIYLYSAKYTPDMNRIIHLVDGIHFTLHVGSTKKDIEEFYIAQKLFSKYRKSFRLFIHPDIQKNIAIIPKVWKRIEVKPWLGEQDCQLPSQETLFILKSKEK